MFIIHTNGIYSQLPMSGIMEFADDLTMYISGEDLCTVLTQMKDDLRYLADWLKANSVSLNA